MSEMILGGSMERSGRIRQHIIEVVKGFGAAQFGSVSLNALVGLGFVAQIRPDAA